MAEKKIRQKQKLLKCVSFRDINELIWAGQFRFDVSTVACVCACVSHNCIDYVSVLVKGVAINWQTSFNDQKQRNTFKLMQHISNIIF